MDTESLKSLYRFQRENLRRRVYSTSPAKELDAGLYRQLGSNPDDVCAMTDTVLAYFWAANCRYRDPHETIAYYPGYPSIYGARNDGIEGITRLLPLWAAYASSAAAGDELAAAMRAHLVAALSHGTDPDHEGYWGAIGDKSTLICEAADVALACWLLRGDLAAMLGEPVTVRVTGWLQQALDKVTVDNNWHLFVILIDKVLQAIVPGHVYRSGDRYQRIKSFYRGDGCFTDGPGGDIDLYNAWGFHYVLFWLDQIDPGFDPAFIRQVAGEYVAWFQYLFTHSGVVLYGRSLPYRMAMPVPVLAAAQLAPEQMGPGVALACYRSCWQYFLQRRCLRYGRPTQGVFADNPLLLDPYSGPASSFWGTRSMVLFYYLQPSFSWRTIAAAPLPATVAPATMRVQALGAMLTLEPQKELATLTFDDRSLALAEVVLQRPSFRDRIRECLYATSCRPANNLFRQGVGTFSSDLREYAYNDDQVVQASPRS